MVDKKACKVRKRKYKINGAVLATRLSIFVLVVGAVFTCYTKFSKDNLGKVVESSSYIDSDGISSMVTGVQNGGVYTSAVTPVIKDSVVNATLSKDGEEIKFKSGKKISKMGSYILVLEDKDGNIDTVYFDIEK